MHALATNINRQTKGAALETAYVLLSLLTPNTSCPSIAGQATLHLAFARTTFIREATGWTPASRLALRSSFPPGSCQVPPSSRTRPTLPSRPAVIKLSTHYVLPLPWRCWSPHLTQPCGHRVQTLSETIPGCTIATRVTLLRDRLGIVRPHSNS